MIDEGEPYPDIYRRSRHHRLFYEHIEPEILGLGIDAGTIAISRGCLTPTGQQKMIYVAFNNGGFVAHYFDEFGTEYHEDELLHLSLLEEPIQHDDYFGRQGN